MQRSFFIIVGHLKTVNLYLTWFEVNVFSNNSKVCTKFAPLTTSGILHPVFNLDPSRLAGVRVRLQDSTKEAFVSPSHA